MNINKLGEDIEKDRQLKIIEVSDELYEEMKADQANESDLYWYKKYNELKGEHNQLQTDYNARDIDCKDLSAIVREQAEALEVSRIHLRNSEQMRDIEIETKRLLIHRCINKNAEIAELKQQLKAK